MKNIILIILGLNLFLNANHIAIKYCINNPLDTLVIKDDNDVVFYQSTLENQKDYNDSTKYIALKKELGSDWDYKINIMGSDSYEMSPLFEEKNLNYKVTNKKYIYLEKSNICIKPRPNYNENDIYKNSGTLIYGYGRYFIDREGISYQKAQNKLKKERYLVENKYRNDNWEITIYDNFTNEKYTLWKSKKQSSIIWLTKKIILVISSCGSPCSFYLFKNLDTKEEYNSQFVIAYTKKYVAFIENKKIKIKKYLEE